MQDTNTIFMDLNEIINNSIEGILIIKMVYKRHESVFT